jgi:hypothetical protein
MNRKLGLLMTSLVVLGTIATGADSASAASRSIPFEGSYAGAFDGATLSFNGTGNATHLGRSTNQGYAVITGSDSSCPGGLANTNHETFDAANGDALTIVSSDVACPISQTATRGIGHWTVTGGTGRFSGATGEGTIDGGADFAQGVFHFQVTGSISLSN